jgi:hypothetical protein
MRPSLLGLRTNLYMAFMDTSWRNMRDRGIAGLVHPESHFTDPKAGGLRQATYAHLRRHWQFTNALFLFEDIHDMNVFGIHIYGSTGGPEFAQMSYLFHPDMVDRSLEHDGKGPTPGIQYQEGGWDLRPHSSRVLQINENVLADWVQLFDEPGTPPTAARLLRPVTTADLSSLSAIAANGFRVADAGYCWTRGWRETDRQQDGTIISAPGVVAEWESLILQGPHFNGANPLAQQPRVGCRHNQDYESLDLEGLPERVIPRTNFLPGVEIAEYQSRMDHWRGEPSSAFFRCSWRSMTQPGLERSLQPCLIPPGPMHVHAVYSAIGSTNEHTVLMASLWASLPLDYMIKISGKTAIQEEFFSRFPAVNAGGFARALSLRGLRLNCLSAHYAPLWEELYRPQWKLDRWTSEDPPPTSLGSVSSAWTSRTPLRRDADRWQALVEIDALAALLLGLTAEQLRAMYRTQFAVLRKYEYKMVLDAEGRKICGYHQSAGYRQSHLQEQAKSGDLPPEWKNLWNVYEQYEANPDAVDWLGHYTAPFTRVDREGAMTRAYNEFQRRFDAGEYGEE